jgi:hypothetical protein
VVGLGGSGAKVVRQLKKKWGDVPLLKYLVIDSDRSEKKEEGVELSDVEFLHIGVSGRIKDIIESLPGLERKQREEVRRWLPKEPSLDYRNSDDDLTKGAKQIRCLGRLALFYNIVQVYDRLRGLMNSITNPDEIKKARNMGYKVDARDSRVFIVSSLGGGCGSGIFIDIAYLVKYISTMTTGFEINGIFVLPSAFKDASIRGDAVRANTYAALMELDHYMSGGKFKCSYKEDLKIKDDIEKPFKYVYLVSGNTEGGVGLDIRDVAKIVTEVISLNIGLSRTGGLQAQIANHIDPCLVSRADGAIKGYGSFGFALLFAPFTNVTRYCINRLSREIIELFTGDVEHKSVESEEGIFAGMLKIEKLKDEIKVEGIERPEISVESRNLIDDIHTWRVSVNIEEEKEKIEGSRKRIESERKKKIFDRVKALTNGKSPSFARDFLDILDSKMMNYIIGTEGVDETITELRQNKEAVAGSEEKVRKDLKDVIASRKPLLIKRKTLARAKDDYIANLLSQFEYELELKRMEEIRQLYRDVREKIKEESDVVKGIIMNLDSVKKDFKNDEVKEKSEIERMGEFFEDKVKIKKEKLEEMYGMKKEEEAGKLARIEDIYGWKDLEKNEIYKRIKKFSEGEVKVNRSVIEFFKSEGGLQEKIKGLFDNIEMLWELKPGFDISAQNIISIVGIESGKSDVIENPTGTEVVEGADKEVVMLSQFKYCVPASAYKEVDVCKMFYDIQSEKRDLHTDYSVQFESLKEVKEVKKNEDRKRSE